MSIEFLVKLVSETANGKDDFHKGAVGTNGYGFIFKDLNAKLPYVKFMGSSKVFCAGAYKNFMKKFEKILEKKSLFDLVDYDEKYDLLFVGSVKTLVPMLQFGGYEELFDVWMFVKTPDGKLFPARFYWGQSGISIAGWNLKLTDHISGKSIFPKDFERIVNFTPFNFSDDEREEFLEALELALYKVPISDFWGVFNHDAGNSLMGVQRGESYWSELGNIRRLDNTEKYEKELEPLLDKVLRDEDGNAFTIKLLPGRKIYAIDRFATLSEMGFGNARQMLIFLEDIQYEKQKLSSAIK
jgi:hypothetical protein